MKHLVTTCLAGISCLAASGSAHAQTVYQSIHMQSAKDNTTRNAENSLVSGQAVGFTAAAVSASTLFFGDSEYIIAVPAGATRLDVKLTTFSPVDLGLFVRFAQSVTLSNGTSGTVISDFASSTYKIEETVSIAAPLLQSGVYYIAIAAFTTGVPISGTVTATVSGSIPANALAASHLVAGDGWATSLFVSFNHGRAV